MAWGPWSAQAPKNGRSRKRDDNKGKDNKKDSEHWVRPYDSGVSLPQQSSSSSSQEAQFMQEFMVMVRESNIEVPDRLQKFLPDGAKSSLKEQQKMLNKKRNIMNKIENKRKAIVKDQESWEAWTQQMRTEIQQQKQKHEEHQKKLSNDLAELLEEEKKLNAQEENAEEEESINEMDLEEFFDAALTDPYAGTPVAADANKPPGLGGEAGMNETLVKMQRQMEMQYNQKLVEQKKKLMEEYNEKLSAAVIDLSKEDKKENNPLEKNPLAPFGVQRTRTSHVTSPYSRTVKMGEMMDAANKGEAKHPKGDVHGEG